MTAEAGILSAALEAHSAGLCPIPAAADGSKAPHPDGPSWKRWQAERPDADCLRQWLGSGRYDGFGLVCGSISGGLEMLEFEGRAVRGGILAEFQAAAQAMGLFGVLRRITDGYYEKTPGGGIHLFYFCDQASNAKLASRPATTEELAADPHDRHKTLIETKGEGGFTIVAPSNGKTHPTGGSWVLVRGGFGSIVRITTVERQALLDLARSFDQMPAPIWDKPEANRGNGGLLPGADFNARGDIEGIFVPAIEAAEWVAVSGIRGDGNQLWRRPGKDKDHSATLHRAKRVFYVHSTSTAFPETPKGYSLFAALAFGCYEGDFSAAASWLRSLGYGDDPPAAKPAAPSAGQEQTWPRLDPAALIGIPGQVVELFAPYSEADPVALLLSFLVGFGNAVGRRPHIMADGNPHRANLFALLGGRTSKARKGTAWARSRSLLVHVDSVWLADRVKSGLSSGEGLIAAVADEETNKKGEIVTEGKDKRLLVIEEEFAKVLVVANRKENSLSAILRQAWDGIDLGTMTKTPMSARGPHISMIGHITLEELRVKLTETEQFNGFVNRYLCALVTRSQILPHGGDPEQTQLRALAQAIAKTRQGASQQDLIQRSPEAQERWADLYQLMAEDDEGGMVGAAAARVEADTLRLSLVYALACGSAVVQLEHLEAAWALWRYCRQSLDYIFGDKVGDEVADRLLGGLREAFPDGLDRDAQHQLLGRHTSANRLSAASDLLIRLGLARLTEEQTGGRPRQVLTYREPG